MSDAARIEALESALADLLCHPDVRDAADERTLRNATTALAESRGLDADALDAESRRIADRWRGAVCV